MTKQFLKFGAARYDGWGCDGCYVWPYSVTDEDGQLVAEGELITTPQRVIVEAWGDFARSSHPERDQGAASYRAVIFVRPEAFTQPRP